MNVNLACGGTFVDQENWLNLDYSKVGLAVQQANLLGRLPLSDSTADLVYSSHFLEHIPVSQVTPFLHECCRILKPGGVLRLVVPDLEDICRTYLHYRNLGDHEKADFVVLELLDQCVRSRPGGNLGSYYQNLVVDPDRSASRKAFVLFRTGEDLMHLSSRRHRSLRTITSRLPALVERLWIRVVLKFLPPAFREQNVSLATIGERHQWLYDTHSLSKLLSASGFVAIERCTASTSRYMDFPFYPLDMKEDGSPRKGAESLFIEAQKPG